MNFIDLAKKRRSVRSYLSEQVKKEDIEKIIQAGTWAPSAFNQQVLKYFILQDKEKIKLASEAIMEEKLKNKNIKSKIRPVNDPVYYEAPTVIFVCTKKPLKDYAEIDTFFFSQNCFLQAEELGLGTCAIGATKLLENNSIIKKQLGMSEDWQILFSFCLGYPAQKTPAPERKEPEIIYED